MSDGQDTRTHTLRLRLTPAEKARVEAEARAERLTVSDLIRERLGLALSVTMAETP